MSYGHTEEYDHEQVLGREYKNIAREHERSEMRYFWVAERFDNMGRSTGYYSGPNAPFFTDDLDKAVQFSRKRDVFWTGYTDQTVRYTEHWER